MKFTVSLQQVLRARRTFLKSFVRGIDLNFLRYWPAIYEQLCQVNFLKSHFIKCYTSNGVFVHILLTKYYDLTITI